MTSSLIRNKDILLINMGKYDYSFITDLKSKVKKSSKKKTIKKKISELDKGDGRYGSFLLSEYWKVVRESVLQRDNRQCQLCGSRKHLIVHHLSYEHHGDEWRHKGDLVTLCRSCHENVHRVKYVERELLHKIGLI